MSKCQELWPRGLACSIQLLMQKQWVMTHEGLQARTETWPAPLTHVLAELSLPVTSEVPLKPGAEISQGAGPAAVLGSPSIYPRTPLLPLVLVSKQLPRLPADPIGLLPWHPLGMMFSHLWLLLWSPPLSLQALSQCG